MIFHVQPIIFSAIFEVLGHQNVQVATLVYTDMFNLLKKVCPTQERDTCLLFEKEKSHPMTLYGTDEEKVF